MQKRLLSALLLSSTLAVAETPPPMLTGEVFSLQAQEIIVPLTTTWRSRISTMVPEGSLVEAGDLVVEFDGTEAAAQLEGQREAARTEQARTERDLARLEKELGQARHQLDQAQVRLELARLQAEVPEDLMGAIEYAENQLVLEESLNGLEDARKQFDDRQKSLAERKRQTALDARKLAAQERWWAQMLESFTIEANQTGYVIYMNHPWTRAKFQEGDTVQTSFRVAQVADTSDLAVRVWVNGVDRPRVSDGDAVTVRLDAISDRSFSGRLTDISESGSKRQEWGDADYFEAVVVLEDAADAGLLPGMSALVEVL